MTNEVKALSKIIKSFTKNKPVEWILDQSVDDLSRHILDSGCIEFTDSKILEKTDVSMKRDAAMVRAFEALRKIPSRHYPITMINGRQYYYMNKEEIFEVIWNSLSSPTL